MTETKKQPRTKGLFLPPLLQLLLSGTGLAISLLVGVLFILGGAFGFFGQNLGINSPVFFSTASSFLLIGLLLLVPLVQSLQQLTGRETHFSQKRYFRAASILMVLWVPLLLLGQWIAKSETLPWLFLPLLQVILVAAPIFFLVELARRGLTHPEGGGAGVFTFGVMLTQPLVVLVELISLAGLGILALIWISTQPALMDEITRLGQHLMDTQMDPRVVQQILIPYLQKPGLIIAVLIFGAGLVPLMEELLKPLALWVMVGRKMDEPAGFVLGLFAGGTFALLESLGISVSAAGQEWASIIVARLGTGILHVTTAALLGWGLAAAWSKRKYLQLGITFLVSFTLHAVWNLLGISLGIGQNISADANTLLSSFGPAALTALAVGMVLILLTVNYHLRTIQSGIADDQAVISPQTPNITQHAGNTDDHTEKV